MAPTDFTGGVFIYCDAEDPDDIASIVADGLPDSPMPAWEMLLAPSDRRAVAEVVARFAR